MLGWSVSKRREFRVRCANCGRTLSLPPVPGEWLTCPECGNRVSAPSRSVPEHEEHVRCSNCWHGFRKADLGERSTFRCPQCGERVNAFFGGSAHLIDVPEGLGAEDKMTPRGPAEPIAAKPGGPPPSTPAKRALKVAEAEPEDFLQTQVDFNAAPQAAEPRQARPEVEAPVWPPDGFARPGLSPPQKPPPAEVPKVISAHEIENAPRAETVPRGKADNPAVGLVYAGGVTRDALGIFARFQAWMSVLVALFLVGSVAWACFPPEYQVTLEAIGVEIAPLRLKYVAEAAVVVFGGLGGLLLLYQSCVLLSFVGKLKRALKIRP